MSDGIGLAEVLLGLPGFRVLDVVESALEVVITIESTAVRAHCRTCGVRAEPQDRVPVDVRDLACFGRPARLRWIKRRWRCREPQCPARTWTETSEHVEACRQVGENARPVSQLADELGVCWCDDHERRRRAGKRSEALRRGPLPDVLGSPYGIRTRAATLRGWCPRPL